MSWSIFHELLCFVARRVVKSLEQAGQTSLKLHLVGTDWSLKLERKRCSVARPRARKSVSTSAEPIISDAITSTRLTGDGSPRTSSAPSVQQLSGAADLANSRGPYDGHSATLHLLH